VVKSLDWVPDRGDIVWMNFSPQVGREQAGYRPALTVSPLAFNRMLGVGLFCPIRSRAKGYPFEVLIPPGSRIEGAVLTEQVRSIDWRARNARPAGRASPEVIEEALGKLRVLMT